MFPRTLQPPPTDVHNNVSITLELLMNMVKLLILDHPWVASVIVTQRARFRCFLCRLESQQGESQSPRKRSSRPSKPNATAKRTNVRSIGPYDRAFQQHLIDHNILPHAYEYPDGRSPPEPENKDDILRALAQPRESLSLSDFPNFDFRKFDRVDANASKEREVMTTVIPIIEGDVEDRKCITGEIPFTNLDHLTDGTLVPGNPDLFYGSRPEKLDERIRDELGGYVIPSTRRDLPVAPNFFVEVKGKDGSAAVAQRQLSYDMALGERGQQALRSCNPSNVIYDNRAHTLGCTYLDGQLKMFASHAIQPPMPGGQPGFVMTQLGAFALTNDLDTFWKGTTAYRNGRDWAKKQRDDVIKKANKRETGGEVIAFFKRIWRMLVYGQTPRHKD